MPFLTEMLLVSLLGVGLAIGLLWYAVHLIFNSGINQIAQLQAFIGAHDVWAIAPWMAAGVLLLTVLTSLVTLRRYLRV
jgi:cell division transport system permease protein